MKPFYVLHPGIVVSRYDGQEHYITAQQLAGLYRVNQNDCAVYRSENDQYRTPRPLVHLYPRDDGNYTLPQYAAGKMLRESLGRHMSGFIGKPITPIALAEVQAAATQALRETAAAYPDLFEETVEAVPCGSNRIVLAWGPRAQQALEDDATNAGTQ
ncbi:hypothetical protein [Microvirga sp. 17 mud 1-3]|uniref:hypothetical protein n=1 Tax=Microvirga sp. 17 mud 1-3 TaxID=2082949 RepID=UPI000D6A8F5C|nr:hypothetical protein [Microvirga sp. 17 mud 1-3]AWM87351.1 hypothetical protein C4E04_11810 [Microvirga sp. 17 mud 1-3]